MYNLLTNNKTRKIILSNTADLNDTIVSLIMDESASMSTVQEDTVDGINDCIQELKTDPSPTLIRIQKFNSLKFSVVYNFEQINQVREMKLEQYSPKGRTPLLDAVGLTIEETSKHIELNSLENSKVIISIMTDGMENASSDYSITQIRTMIEEKQKLGWEFTYMGANHDSWSVASRFGLKQTHVKNYTYSNPKEALLKNARNINEIKQQMREGRIR